MNGAVATALVESHLAALGAGVLIRRRATSRWRDIAGWVGEWAEVRKGVDLVRDLNGERDLRGGEKTFAAALPDPTPPYLFRPGATSWGTHR